MSGEIFISYRREENRWSAKALHRRLTRDFDSDQIFIDLDSIGPGDDFVQTIKTAVEKCDVLTALIGKNWLQKDENGNRRLDNPEDFVRMEIATALRREIRVIPVLVDDALMPRSTDLPDDLKTLARRNALRITLVTSFEADCQRLVAAIRQALEKARESRAGEAIAQANPIKPLAKKPQPHEIDLRFVANSSECYWGMTKQGDQPIVQIVTHWNVTNMPGSIMPARLLEALLVEPQGEVVQPIVIPSVTLSREEIPEGATIKFLISFLVKPVTEPQSQLLNVSIVVIDQFANKHELPSITLKR
jgi:TIR domain